MSHFRIWVVTSFRWILKVNSVLSQESILLESKTMSCKCSSSSGVQVGCSLFLCSQRRPCSHPAYLCSWVVVVPCRSSGVLLLEICTLSARMELASWAHIQLYGPSPARWKVVDTLSPRASPASLICRLIVNKWWRL